MTFAVIQTGGKQYKVKASDILKIEKLDNAKEKIEFNYFVGTGRVQKRKHAFEGVLNNFKRRYEETESNTVRDELAKFLSNQICPSCNGTRLREEARNVLVGDMNLHHICELPLRKAFDFFNKQLRDFFESNMVRILIYINIKLNTRDYNHISL